MIIVTNGREDSARSGAIYYQYKAGNERVEILSCEYPRTSEEYNQALPYIDSSQVYTIENLKEVNASLPGALYFFSKDTMRFFDSRVSDHIKRVNDGILFITSEKYNSESPRLYTLRLLRPNNTVESISEFQEYTTSKQAVNAMRDYPGNPIIK